MQNSNILKDKHSTFDGKVLRVSKPKNYSVASLFAGIGGVELGFQRADCRIQWANEIDEKACKTYTSNFNHTMICDDIKNLNPKKLEKVDILTAGFPCQAFSIAGYQKGFEDARGSLFFDVMHIVDVLKPRVLFLENVKNLKSHNKGETLRKIIATIEKSGYSVKYEVLNTCEYSKLPQNRERIYIVGFKDKADYENFEFPQKETETLPLTDLLENKVDDTYYYTKSKFYATLKEKVTNKNTCYQWRRKYVRENKSNLCPTLTANMGTGGHNVPLVLDKKDIRKLTPRECIRLQGFHDDYKLPCDLANSYLYKQAGNSVSVPVIEKIAKNIIKSLNKNG